MQKVGYIDQASSLLTALLPSCCYQKQDPSESSAVSRLPVAIPSRKQREMKATNAQISTRQNLSIYTASQTHSRAKQDVTKDAFVHSSLFCDVQNKSMPVLQRNRLLIECRGTKSHSKTKQESDAFYSKSEFCENRSYTQSKSTRSPSLARANIRPKSAPVRRQSIVSRYRLLIFLFVIVRSKYEGGGEVRKIFFCPWSIILNLP